MPYEAMCLEYPRLKKTPYLLPVYWCARWIKCINIDKIKKAKTEFEASKSLSKKQQLEREKLLKELELDTDKFWCLYLFALDYCCSLFYQGVTMKATPFEQLQKLVELIVNADNETATLNFKIGKQKISVESPIALQFLATAIQNQLNGADHSTIKSLYTREENEETIMIKDSPIIVYFAKILLSFFDTQEHIKGKRKKGANYSIKEMDLVSQLIYFSNLSDNYCWIDIENETLKAFLKQYKDYEYPNNVSNVYPEFIVH
jgi:hypothetical protein